MLETPGDSPATESPEGGEAEAPAQEGLDSNGTAEGEGEGQAAEPTEIDLANQRVSDAQARMHEATTEVGQLRETVNLLLQRAGGQAAAPTGPSNEDINAELENAAKTKGAGVALNDMITKAVQRNVQAIAGPAFQELNRLKTQMTVPDYAELQGEIQNLLKQAETGKITIDDLLVDAARGRKSRATPGIVKRSADQASRGSGLGATRTSGRPASASKATALTPDMPAEQMAARILKDPTVPQSQKDVILVNHPQLRGKE